MAIHEKIFSIRNLLVASAVGLLLGAWAPGEGGPEALSAQDPGSTASTPASLDRGRERSPRRIMAGEVASPIEVDGVVSAEEWAGVPEVPLPWEVDPAENGRAPVETVCRIAFDPEYLYLGCAAEDPDPGSVRAWITDRDGIGDHDRIVVTLDPFGDRRRGFLFGVSAHGVQFDARFNQQGTPREDGSWDAIWSSAGRVTEGGYEVEAAIPFRSLRFPEREGEHEWGLLISRFRPRSSRVELRSAPLDRDEACMLCQANRLGGLRGIAPGRNVQLSPTVTASRTDGSADGGGGLEPGSVSGDPGLDLRWSPLPELAINATVNPDFSQVEADAAQLDVNRTFALFFPEKRPFFQEGADVFQTPIRALFTRSVVDPSVGGKVTGKIDDLAVGAMAVRDEVNVLLLPGPEGSASVELDEAVTTGVARIRRDVGASSTLGALGVVREGRSYHNRVAGVDAFLQPRPSLTVRAQALRSSTQYPAEITGTRGSSSAGDGEGAAPRSTGSAFGGTAFQGGVRYQTREWILNSDVRYRGHGFRADAGFQPQVGVKGGTASVERVVWGGGGRWFDRLSAQTGVWRTEEIEGPLLDGGFWAGITFRGPLQSGLTYFPNVLRQGFGGEEFAITTHFLSGSFRPVSDLGLRVQAVLGDAVDFANVREARQTSLTPAVDLRLGRRTKIDLSHRFQRLETREGALEIFTAQVSDLRIVYNFSNRAFVRGIVQHRLTDRNPAAHQAEVPTRVRSLFTQLLFSYKVNPQTLVFLGWSDDRAGTSELPGRALSLEPRARSFFLKLGYAWRP